MLSFNTAILIFNVETQSCEMLALLVVYIKQCLSYIIINNINIIIINIIKHWYQTAAVASFVPTPLN